MAASATRFTSLKVTSEKDAADVVALAKKKFNKLDILVNSAGVVHCCPTYDRAENKAHPLDAWAHVINVNLIGAFNMLRLASQVMAENKPGEDNQRGVIINVSSIAAYDGRMGHSAYAASKAGMSGMSLPLARDLGREGIRVMSISPGLFDTPMLASLPPSYMAQNTLYPNRFGYPEEFAHLVVSIIENRMFNGFDIRLDGAVRLGP